MLHSQDTVTGLPAFVEVVGGALRVTSAPGAAGGAVFNDPANPLNQRVTETVTATSIVAAATAVSVLPASTTRKTAGLINTGVNDAWWGTTAGVTAATGWPLYGGGGGYVWAIGEAPANAIFVFSTTGTTIIAKSGV